MSTFAEPPRGEQPPIRHELSAAEQERRLAGARIIVENSIAAGEPVDFREAHNAVTTLHDAYTQPMTTDESYRRQGQESSPAMPTPRFFRLAECLGTVLAHGEPDMKT